MKPVIPSSRAVSNDGAASRGLRSISAASTIDIKDGVLVLSGLTLASLSLAALPTTGVVGVSIAALVPNSTDSSATETGIEKVKAAFREIKQINYSALQQAEFGIFVDEVWELYDLYFSATETSLQNTLPVPTSTLTPTSTPTATGPGAPSATPTPTPSVTSLPPSSTVSSSTPSPYEIERGQFFSAFLNAFRFIAEATASGVIGNVVYDMLKRNLQKLRDSSKGESLDIYDRVIADAEGIAKRLREAEQRHEEIYSRDLAKYAGGSIVKARSWAKTFGWVHSSRCAWHSPIQTPSDQTSLHK